MVCPSFRVLLSSIIGKKKGWRKQAHFYDVNAACHPCRTGSGRCRSNRIPRPAALRPHSAILCTDFTAKHNNHSCCHEIDHPPTAIWSHRRLFCFVIPRDGTRNNEMPHGSAYVVLGLARRCLMWFPAKTESCIAPSGIPLFRPSMLGSWTAERTIGEKRIPVKNAKSEPVSHLEDLVRIMLTWYARRDLKPHVRSGH